MAIRALLMNEDDQVATLISSVKVGEEIEIYHHDKFIRNIKSCEPIPFGHKISIFDMMGNQLIKKYGEPIGRLSKSIKCGAYVHVHNLVSTEKIDSNDEPIKEYIDAQHLRKFVVELIQKCGASQSAALNLADALIEAELRGVETHGLNRLPQYTKRMLNGTMNGVAEPNVEVQGNIIRVDGNNAIGHHIAQVTIDHMIPIAKSKDVAVAVVRNSNHFGFAGFYATKMAEHDMVAIITSNGTPLISVTNGKVPFFSNNPFSIAAPISEEEFVEMDLALSLTSRARIQQAWERKEMIPRGWANGPDGYPTLDPKSALEGSMNPLGGERGFAMLFGLEILSGLLSGGSTADEVKPKDNGNSPEGTCHFFIALNIEAFLKPTHFRSNLRDLIERMHCVPRITSGSPPRYPGERRWINRKKRLKEGIPLDSSMLAKLDKLSKELAVPFLK